MEIKFWNQPKDLSLKNVLSERLKKNYQRVWLIAGVAKDTGIELLMDAIEEARKAGTEVNIYLGLDRKNISKDMLMRLIQLGCHLYLHINRDESKVETRMYLFESDEKGSLIYQASGKLSEGGLTTNHCVVQEIAYLPTDKKAFDNAKAAILQGCEFFQETNEEELKLLAEKGEVVARIIERKIPSISEMFGGASIEAIGNDVYDESTSGTLFTMPQNTVDIDVDVDWNNHGATTKAELSAESEAKKEKKEKESIDKLAAEKLSKFYVDTMEEETEKKVSIIKGADHIDFSHMNILVCELNKMADKGISAGEVKLPTYLYEETKEFWNGETFSLVRRQDGKEKLGKAISLEVIDTMHNETKEEETVIYLEDKYFAIYSQALSAMNPEEKDYIRIIRKGTNDYAIELIRKNSKEYEIWDNFCVFAMKNSKRKFGIM